MGKGKACCPFEILATSGAMQMMSFVPKVGGFLALFACVACATSEAHEHRQPGESRGADVGTSSSALMKGGGVKSDCTIQLCNGLKQPGEFQCWFGVCMCVAKDVTAECNGGTTCKETGCDTLPDPILKDPFVQRAF